MPLIFEGGFWSVFAVLIVIVLLYFRVRRLPQPQEEEGLQRLASALGGRIVGRTMTANHDGVVYRCRYDLALGRRYADHTPLRVMIDTQVAGRFQMGPEDSTARATRSFHFIRQRRPNWADLGVRVYGETRSAAQCLYENENTRQAGKALLTSGFHLSQGGGVLMASHALWLANPRLEPADVTRAVSLLAILADRTSR